MITSSWLNDSKNSNVYKIEDEHGKSIKICPSRVESDFLAPRQLLQAALAGCLSMTVRRELSDAGITFTDVKVGVDMSEEDGQTIFSYEIGVESEDAPEKIESVRKHAAENCYIKKLLSDGILIREREDKEQNTVCDCCCG